jgi:hypothetical protein
MGDKVHVACATHNESNSVQVWIFTQSVSPPQEDGEWRLSATLDQKSGDSYTDPIIVAEGGQKRLYGISNGKLMTWIDKDAENPAEPAELKPESDVLGVARLIPIARTDSEIDHLSAIGLDKNKFIFVAGDHKCEHSSDVEIDTQYESIAWEINQGSVNVVHVAFFIKGQAAIALTSSISAAPTSYSFNKNEKRSIGPILGKPSDDTIYFSIGNELHSWRPLSDFPTNSIIETSPRQQLVACPTVAAGRLIAPLRDTQTAAVQSNLLPGLIELDAYPFVDLSSNHAKEQIKSELLIAVLNMDIFDMEVIDFIWIGEAGSAKSQGVILNPTQSTLNNEIHIYIREKTVKKGWKVAPDNQGGWELEAGSVENGVFCAAKINDKFYLWQICSNNGANKYKLKFVASKDSADTLSGVYAVQHHKDWDKKTFAIKYKSPLSNWNPKDVSFATLSLNNEFSFLAWEKWGSSSGNTEILVKISGSIGNEKTLYAHRPLAWTSTESSPTRALELSWEYWNGKSWWQIGKVEGNARNLVSGTNVTLPVPPDLHPTDVLGRRNHWIRARLVGGDYGEAKTTVETVINPPDPKTQTVTQTQTIHRDPSTISAPYINSLTIGYTMTKGVAPQVVLTEDNGGWLDQSGAARTPNAQVSVFTPRDAALAALEAAPLVQDQAWVSQALYLGFDGPLTGNAVSLFFLVDELDGDMVDGLRLAVDALGKDGFRQVSAVDDQTNGLSESGTLTLNLPAPPVQTRLFGEDAWWLRLRPALAGQVEGWRPRLKGAWLNGCWALAAETIELERLGSSDGSPGQAVRLARPPVIADSLELRIREPLGDEDVEALTRDKADTVRQDLPGLPGVWVLWREVPDIDDAGPGERAYALDDERGEIRFGDGLHGRIPPIGRDAILAVAYRKGGGAAANGVRAWSKMNLVTPLQGVAEATIVEGAAGGADPQAPETALAFAPQALGLRDRALTLQDLAVLACQSSPGIAQAFAFQAGEGTCLVVVMAGSDPQPSQATLRELRSYLAERSLPSLIRKFELRGPARVELQIELTLDVDALAYSGQLAADAAGAVSTLLHPAHGGLDGQGWPLGALPGEAEIAAVLGELAHLRGIAAVTLVGSDGNAIVPPLAPHQLAVLAPDGVHCIFTATGGTAHA